VQSYASLIEGPLHTSQLIDEANLQFKVQVQEWKNVLLRGKQPADLDKYWSQFQERQRDVQGILARLGLRPAASRSEPRIERCATNTANWARLPEGPRCLSAAGADPTAGDTAVKGVDRAASDQMSAWSASCANKAPGNRNISASADARCWLGLA
jgi:methyl-accepting chemotaxis protein